MRITLNLATRPFADLGPAIKRLRIAHGGAGRGRYRPGPGPARLPPEGRGSPRPRPFAGRPRSPRINQERQGYQEMMRQPANAQLLTQAEALNQLFDEKAFSWTLAMEDLETVLPGGVQVYHHRTGARQGRPHQPAFARDWPPRPHRRSGENLEHSKRFLLPRIVGENSESSGGPNQRLEPVSAFKPRQLRFAGRVQSTLARRTQGGRKADFCCRKCCQFACARTGRSPCASRSCTGRGSSTPHTCAGRCPSASHSCIEPDSAALAAADATVRYRPTAAQAFSGLIESEQGPLA